MISLDWVNIDVPFSVIFCCQKRAISVVRAIVSVYLKVSECPFKQNKNMKYISLNVLRPPFSIYMIYLFYFLQILVKLGLKLAQKLTTFSIFWALARTDCSFQSFFTLICSQPRDKQNRACNFLRSKYFLNNLLLTVSCKICFQTSSSYWNKKWITLY